MSAAKQLRARRTMFGTETADRERRKRLWLDPLYADLDTPEALEMAKQHHVSLRLAGHVAGFIVNLDSFLDQGYIWASQEGLAGYVKNYNGQPMSNKQIGRVIAFLEARNHLGVKRTRGIRNEMRPIYRLTKPVSEPSPADATLAPDCRSASDAIMSVDQGHDVRGVRTSCPPNPIIKPISKTYTPLTPQSEPSGNVVRLGEKTASLVPSHIQDHPVIDSHHRPKRVEGREVIEHRLARRLGSGDVAAGVLILLELPDNRRDELTAMERNGKLTDVEINRLLDRMAWPSATNARSGEARGVSRPEQEKS